MKTPRERMIEALKEASPLTMEAWAYESDVPKARAEMIANGLLKAGIVRFAAGGVWVYRGER
jgi:hypothetical protein